MTRLGDSLKRSSVTFRTEYVKELTTALCRCVRVLLTSHGYGSPSYRRTSKEQGSIDHIIDLMQKYDDGESVKVIKYLTAVYMPRVGHDAEVPERPDFLPENSTLFLGEYKHFIERIFRGRRQSHHKTRYLIDNKSRQRYSCEVRQTDRDLMISLAMGILQLKRGMPPLPENLKLKARKDLQERLTTPAVTPRVLVDQVCRTANELFPVGWDKKCPIPSYAPSRSSCVQNTRGEGGIQSFVFDKQRTGSKNHLNQVLEPLPTTEIALKEGYKAGHFAHPNMITQDQFEDFALRSQPREFRACVEIVEDPLKARVITKNEWQCQALKPLQKLIHGRLRKHPSFQLIGKVISEEVVAHIDAFEDCKFVSGDYSAATDNLNSDCTEAAIECILGNMRGKLSRKPEFMLLARRSLTGLIVQDKELGLEYMMSRGQLMGSLLSFPILCLINFAVWRHSAELAYGTACDGQGKGGIWDKVLINGDDIGFAASNKHYEVWKNLVPQVGLTPSQGKNYFTREFLTLNTRIFRQTVEGHWYHVPFLNVGLLVQGGSDRKNGQTKLGQLESLGAMHDDFVAGAEFKGASSSIFISAWKHVLKKTMRNLFGPKELGGLGAHAVPGSRGSGAHGYSWRQLLVATLIRDRRISVPSGGIVQKYAGLLEAAVKRMFPGKFYQREVDLPVLPEGWVWKDISTKVEDFSASELSMYSWLSPAGDIEKPARDFWKRARKYNTWRAYQGRDALMSWDEYASYEAQRYHWTAFPEPLLIDFAHFFDEDEC
jgi:hypothetical protein